LGLSKQVFRLLYSLNQKMNVIFLIGLDSAMTLASEQRMKVVNYLAWQEVKIAAVV